MTVLSTFLRGVVYAGRLSLREPLPEQPDPDAVALLKNAYDIHVLGVAGEPIPFDAATSVAAGRVLFRAAWYFVHPNEPIEAAGLAMPSEPRTPAQHLSADLVLRYMPALYRRARALRPGDELAGRLADLLHRWPLSGVLADIEDAPLVRPNSQDMPDCGCCMPSDSPSTRSPPGSRSALRWNQSSWCGSSLAVIQPRCRVLVRSPRNWPIQTPMSEKTCLRASEPRTQRSGVSGLPLTPLRCVRGSESGRNAAGVEGTDERFDGGAAAG